MNKVPFSCFKGCCIPVVILLIHCGGALGDCTPTAAEVGGDIPLRLPFRPGERYPVTQGYCKEGWDHSGYQMDFAIPLGTPIVACSGGTVVQLGTYSGNCTDTATSCGLNSLEQGGLFVKIQHPCSESGQSWYSSYLHLSVQSVTNGQLVNASQTIGLSGNTGLSTGPHLHFHIRKGPADNPLNDPMNHVGVRPIPMQGVAMDTGSSPILMFTEGVSYLATEPPDLNLNVMSPIVSYQYSEDFSKSALTNGGIMSPITSYQYFEWPGNTVLNLLSSPEVSYLYPYDDGIPQGPIIVMQAKSLQLDSGKTAQFNVGATGTSPLHYQWLFNGHDIAGATDSTLTINSVTAANSGNYSVVVWNAYGTATSEAASLSVLADGANGIKPVKVVTQPLPEKPSSAKKLVFITHGWQPIWTSHESPQWVTDMGNAIRAKVSSDWQVIPWFWTDSAWTAAPWKALHNAEIIGKDLAKGIESKSFQEIHLIAHSAGSGIIQAIADQLQESPNRPVIHLTFLDPYLGNFSEKQGLYGANARWSDSYYVQDGTGDFTSGYLNHALNVDVSWVDPNHTTAPYIGLGGGKVALSSHGYPCDFYMQSIRNTDPNWCPAEYGFALSQEVEGVFWLNNQANYPVDTGPWVPCSPSDAVKNPNPNITGIEAGIAGIPVDISVVAHAVGDAGSSMISGAGFVLNSVWSAIPHLNSRGLQALDTVSSTNSPAWLAIGVTVTNRINFVQFESGYTDTNAAEGLLTVYWNTNQIGMVDERVASTGMQKYRFALPEAVTNGLYTLSFRLDSFDNTSTIAVTNVATGFAGVSRPITLSLSLTNGSPILKLIGETNYTYLLQSSTNLANWIPKALLLNTNGMVEFIDSEETNADTRYYRAVMP